MIAIAALWIVFGRLDLPAAERLVAAWAGAHRPKVVSWHTKPPLSDVTSTETWARLRAQVFTLRDESWSGDDVVAYLIKDGTVVPMAIGFGGAGLETTVITDLDHNAKPELLYTYSWGSGLHRTHLSLIRFDSPKPTRVDSAVFIPHRVLALRQETKGKVIAVLTGADHGKDVLLGEVTYRKGKLGIAYRPGMKAKWLLKS